MANKVLTSVEIENLWIEAMQQLASGVDASLDEKTLRTVFQDWANGERWQAWEDGAYAADEYHNDRGGLLTPVDPPTNPYN